MLIEASDSQAAPLPVVATEAPPHLAAKPTRERLEYLDTIRGLAALSVIALHYIVAYGMPTRYPRLWEDTPLRIWWDGTAAVSLFFVLSGFVLSLKYFRSSPNPDLKDLSLNKYFVARFFRIWLPYAAVVVLSLLLQRVLPPVHIPTHAAPSAGNAASADVEGAGDYQPRNGSLAASSSVKHPYYEWLDLYWQHPTPMREVARELVLAHQMDFKVIPVAWTLCVELVLSFMVPLGILLAARSSFWLAFVTAFAIKYAHLPHYAFHFAVGLLLAKHNVQIRKFVGQHAAAKWLILILGLTLYTFRHSLVVLLNLHIDSGRISFVTALGAGLLLVFVGGSPITQAVFNHSWLRYVGRVSYGTYLLHMAVMFSLTSRVIARFQSMNPTLLWFLGFVITVGVSLATAGLFYEAVERPSIALGKRLGEKLSRRLGKQPS